MIKLELQQVLSKANRQEYRKFGLTLGSVFSLIGLFLFRYAHVVCVGIIWGFIPLYADTEFSASSSLIGILIMLGIFISGLIHVPMGYIADKFSKKLMVVVGGLIVSYAILSFRWAGDINDLVRASVIFGFGGGIAMPVRRSFSRLPPAGTSTVRLGAPLAKGTPRRRQSSWARPEMRIFSSRGISSSW